MGLKPRQVPVFLESGMEHGDPFRDSITMVLKSDHPEHPNGSPLLLSPVVKNDFPNVSGSNGFSSLPKSVNLQPLRVDVNGCRPSPMVSPFDGHPSSLVSSALPTPLLEFESNSNCSDSGVPQGDLYPSNMGGANMTYKTQSAELKSPNIGNVMHTGLPYANKLITMKSLSASIKKPPESSRKALNEKVTRHRSELKFIVPRASEGNCTHISTMLKKARKHTDLPRAIEASVFEEELIEPLTKTAKVSHEPINEYLTDYSDNEEAPDEMTVAYNVIRACEENSRFWADDTRLGFAIDEKKERLNSLQQKWETFSTRQAPVVDSSLPAEDHCARTRPYIRNSHMKLIRFNRSIDYSTMQPSTSGCSGPTTQQAAKQLKEEFLAVLHFSSMVPSFTIRKTLNQPVHTINARDLDEESARNGAYRRAEKEKRRQREEMMAGKDRGSESSDYEDTDQSDSEYMPKGAPKKIEKRKGRGRPPRDSRDNPPAMSKLGRRQSVANSKQQLYDFDSYPDFGMAALPSKPTYTEISVPTFSIIDDPSLFNPPEGPCDHTFEDLLLEQLYYHRIKEADERAHFRNVGRKKVVRERSIEDVLGSVWADNSPSSNLSPRTAA